MTPFEDQMQQDQALIDPEMLALLDSEEEIPPEEPIEAAAAPIPEDLPPWDLFPVLDAAEIDLINQQVDKDLLDAATDHGVRIKRAREYYRLFRKLIDTVEPGDEDNSNLRVPLVQWSVFQQAAEEFHALFGEGARIKAQPATDETGNDLAKLVGGFMSWLMMSQMRFSRKVMEFLIYRALFGRAYAYRPWIKTEDTFIDDDGTEKTETYYEGPGFKTLWYGDLMRPTGNHHESIHDFEWKAIRRRYRVWELLAGEKRGEFHDVTKNLNDLYRVAGMGASADWNEDELKCVRDEATGVTDSERADPRGEVIVYEYYGKRNLPTVKGYVGEEDWERRELLPTEIVVHRIPALNLCIGVHDLKRLYPRQQRRCPIWESAMPYGDGYERQGLGELLWDLENDLTANQRQFTDAVRMGSQGFGFHEPTVGLPGNLTIEPGVSHPVMNAQGVKWVNPGTDFSGFMMKEQSVLTIAERIKGKSDFGTSSQPSSPNQPRTATGQSLLVQISGVRNAVSMKHFSDDCIELADDLWAMWCNLGDPKTTFQILESDRLDGQLDRSGDGRAKLTGRERNGKYSFAFSFAPNEVERQLKKTESAENFQILASNPLIATNPLALWEVTKQFCDARGLTWFPSVVPKPPDPQIPKDPNAELAMMLNGMDVSPSPAEDFSDHLIKHQMQYLELRRKGRDSDADAIHRLETHIVKTQDMQAAAMQQQQVMGELMQQLGAMQGQQMAAQAKPKGEGGSNGQPAQPR